MKNTSKVLVLGAGGAMGQYLVPELARMGYAVDAVALEPGNTEIPGVRYFTCNAKDPQEVDKLLKNSYDAVVDFLIYRTNELVTSLPRFAEQTGHYIFLSSYRVFDDKEHPVKESSPRLLDTADELALRNSDDYSIYKARGENVIRAMFQKKNWTIVRPAITYSYLRYQLTTLEAPLTVGRAFRNKAVVLPEPAKNKNATMSWAGDVAKMIARLVLNEKAQGEDFNVTTAEHHTWEEIAEYYKEICGLKAVWADLEDYLQIINPDPWTRILNRWQVTVDRMFDRVMDNAKVLRVCNMTQSELKPLFDGLQYEINRCPKHHFDTAMLPMQERMDAYLTSLK